MSNRVHVLHAGYAKLGADHCRANCSCVLIASADGRCNVVVDTMTPWDGGRIVDSLRRHGLSPDDIHFVVGTHGHSDHVGNHNLFLKAVHIVGFCVSFGDRYELHPFDRGVPYKIAEGVEVIATPGHTADDVSVVVRTADQGVVVVAGDTFEREEDVFCPEIWRSEGGSHDPERQERSRSQILAMADWIVPGHGPMFKVTPAMKLQQL